MSGLVDVADAADAADWLDQRRRRTADASQHLQDASTTRSTNPSWTSCRCGCRPRLRAVSRRPSRTRSGRRRRDPRQGQADLRHVHRDAGSQRDRGHHAGRSGHHHGRVDGRRGHVEAVQRLAHGQQVVVQAGAQGRGSPATPADRGRGSSPTRSWWSGRAPTPEAASRASPSRPTTTTPTTTTTP